eukprot:scaffold34634_cov171-Amphora_coffeaeformis.AAC.11
MDNDHDGYWYSTILGRLVPTKPQFVAVYGKVPAAQSNSHCELTYLQSPPRGAIFSATNKRTQRNITKTKKGF